MIHELVSWRELRFIFEVLLQQCLEIGIAFIEPELTFIQVKVKG